MFTHKLEEAHSKRIIFHWFLLSFNAGCINAGGFLATGRFVSHVTGFATLFGVSWVKEDFDVALGILSVPAFFLLGAFLAGLLIDRPLKLGHTPRFDIVMGLAALCLLLAAWGGELTHFGSFGDSIHLQQNYILLSLLCLSCGLQNAAITSSSQSSIRVTHLTGLTTDLGIGLAKLLTINSISGFSNDQAFKKEVKLNQLRLGSIISFVIGSGVGAWFFIELGYKGFVIPSCIALYSVILGRRAKVKFKKN